MRRTFFGIRWVYLIGTFKVFLTAASEKNLGYEHEEARPDIIFILRELSRQILSRLKFGFNIKSGVCRVVSAVKEPKY